MKDARKRKKEKMNMEEKRTAKREREREIMKGRNKESVNGEWVRRQRNEQTRLKRKR